MWGRRKLKKRLDELEEKVLDQQQAVKSKNRRSKFNFNLVFTGLGIVLAGLQVYVALQQNEITERQTTIAENQFEVTKKQSELEEFDIYNKLI
ncbi:MAG: hypothetical protein WBA74_16400 [Cyclobacteriaceae bacterium]